MNKKKANKLIIIAWGTGIVISTLTFYVNIIISQGNFDLSSIFSIIWIVGLTIGIYKKSRICAALLLGSFVIQKIIIIFLMEYKGQVQDFLPLPFLLSSIVIAFCLFLGVKGTFAYHKIKTAEKIRTSEKLVGMGGVYEK